MVFDRRFALAGHEDDVFDAGGASFLDGVLDQRLVDQGQHLLGDGLGRRQEPGAQSGNRENRFTHCFTHGCLFSLRVE